MSILIRNGELERTLNSAGQKLVAIDFSNDNCPPCRMIHPFWESLVGRYKNVVFCTVKCSECPTESQKYGITATPTFIFIRNHKILDQFAGADKNKIIQCLEKNKEVFQGQGRKLDPIPNQEDYFANLQKKRHEQLQQKNQPPQAAPPQAAPPQAIPQKQLPKEIHDELIEFGFSEEKITAAYKATNSNDINVLLNYFENVQNSAPDQQPQQSNAEAGSPEQQPQQSNAEVGSPEQQPQQSNAEVGSPEQPNVQQSAKQEQVANDLTKPLDAEGEKVKEQLVGMGYDGELAQMAINSVGYQNIDKCIEVIGKIERGEPIPMPKHKKTQEEFDAELARYKEIIAKKKQEAAAKVSPKAQAQNELARRKQVLENIEMKRKYDEQQRQLAIEQQQRAKIQDKIDREKVRKKIQAQREEQKRQQEAARSGNAAPPPQQQQQPQKAAPAAKKPITDCTLRLQFPDGTAKVQKFKPEDTIGNVITWIKSNVPAAAYQLIALESAFPKKDFTQANSGQTLLDAQLCPRSQLMVKYV
ncbi:hypothetical protein M9Y10_023015 [Tritrichomonas musculus]|uniref:Thioredoxin family protein n=1 Tax=Tritrichomonas musculus TaxID=1915356 RepID=A0ABR2KTX6_9EUKA